MNAAINALSKAFADFWQPRILALALLPPLAAIVVWIALGWAYAGDWSRMVENWIANTSWLDWVRYWGLAPVLVWTSGVAAIGTLLPVMLITAVLVTATLAMPVIVPAVANRRYPRLERRRGGTFWGSLWNSLAAATVFGLLWLVTLPLWLIGIGALLLPPLLSAGLNRRVFTYDALAEHASAEEIQSIRRAASGELYLLGLLLSLMLYIPLVNLLVPVLAGLAYTHYCLARLERQRAA